MNCPRCDKEISDHEANRCLDAWIAERVLGFEIFDDMKNGVCLTVDRFFFKPIPYYPPHGWLPVYKYSILIEETWEIVAKLTDKTQRFELITGHQDIAWIVGEKSGPKLGLYVCGVGDTMPLAICRVALKLICQ